ncbi:MAG: type II secretion system GspH family protein [Micrococcales bacterium]|nr:type II secretion system GspH family protein [Micrococcales bacterium]
MTRRTRDEAGLGLAEMMVVIMLMGLLSALVLSFTTTVSRKVADSQVMNVNTNEATAAVNATARMLRGAVNLQVRNQPINTPAFVEAGPTAVAFYTVVDTEPATTRPMLVRFEVTPEGNLLEMRWLPDATSTPPFWTFASAAGPPSSSRVVAHGLTATPGNPLFVYLRSDQATPIVGAGPGGALTPAQRTGTIGAVRVNAQVQTFPGGRAAPTTLTSTVGLRNLPEGSS